MKKHFNDKHEIWDYCTYLGSCIIQNDKLDLGILVRKGLDEFSQVFPYSLAIVHGNEDGDYTSGSADMLKWGIESDLNSLEDIFIGLYDEFKVRYEIEGDYCLFHIYDTYKIALVIYNYKNHVNRN